MANIKIILAGFQLVLLMIITGCSSNKKVEENSFSQEKIDESEGSNLKKILEHPQVYVDKDVVFKGVVESIEIRKVNKDITLLTLNLTPVENGELLRHAPISEKFQFIEKLRQFEDLVTSVRYKNMRIYRHNSEQMQKIAFDLKIAASKIEALAFYFEGEGKSEVSASLHKIGKGYKQLGEAYFSFQKAALESSPGSEARFADNEKKEVEKFENSIRKGGELLLDFSERLAGAKDLILRGNYSFSTGNALNKQRSAEILTYSSMLKAESWEKEKSAEIETKNITGALSSAVRELGEGDKLVNEGLLDLGKVLDKTAVQMKKDSVPTIKCAYYGYNGNNLKRCADKIRKMGHFPIGIRGKLVQSDLREEVNIMWVQASELDIDGMIYSLSYGDESGTMKKAVAFYEWAESVEKGD